MLIPEIAGIARWTVGDDTAQLAGWAGRACWETITPARGDEKRYGPHPKRFIKFIKTDLYTGAGICHANNSGPLRGFCGTEEAEAGTQGCDLWRGANRSTRHGKRGQASRARGAECASF